MNFQNCIQNFQNIKNKKQWKPQILEHGAWTQVGVEGTFAQPMSWLEFTSQQCSRRPVPPGLWLSLWSHKTSGEKWNKAGRLDKLGHSRQALAGQVREFSLLGFIGCFCFCFCFLLLPFPNKAIRQRLKLWRQAISWLVWELLVCFSADQSYLLPSYS